MKDILISRCKFALLILTAWLTSCAVVEKSQLQWRYDGSVFTPHAKIETGLDNAYYAFDTPQGLYLAGFKIDNKGINHPYLVFIGKQLSGQIHWPQDRAVEQLFFYKKQLYLLDESGKTQVKAGQHWREHPLTFTANSKVITSRQALIACVPTPLPSADYTRGHCYSPTKNWRRDIAWRSVTPALCNNILLAINDYPAPKSLHYIDIDTGKILNRTSIPDNTSFPSLCDLPEKLTGQP
ncbi:hypothetical protein SG34_002780 [Thalassomonas viridans]|uniref:Lipoprotein n=1 Tax=Thalassomonas viridans TaxID=137584 RepID=A0AAF0C9K7_9GAMM|nr:hypothetical protein [Thalassomonas viridans]WDE05878.1 hypothetical protein SG34_002780 [Thalassomonas viridans]